MTAARDERIGSIAIVLFAAGGILIGMRLWRFDSV
jgi:hypothetical protein